MKNWVKDRLTERTSWDGVCLIGLGLVILLSAPFANIIAYAALGYGVWTVLTSE